MRKLLFLLGSTLALSTLSLADVAPVPELTPFEDDLSEFQVDPVTGLAVYTAALDAVDKTWGVIKNIFSSSEKTSLVEKITKLSFDEMSSTALFRKFQGVAFENLPRIRASISRSAEVPAERQADFNDFFDLIDIQDK
jgi:hypothetical protein